MNWENDFFDFMYEKKRTLLNIKNILNTVKIIKLKKVDFIILYFAKKNVCRYHMIINTIKHII